MNKYWICGAETHRGFVSKEFLYDFNQLVLLLWIQTESKKRVSDKTRNVGLRVSNYLFPKQKKNLLLRIKQMILQPGR